MTAALAAAFFAIGVTTGRSTGSSDQVARTSAQAIGASKKAGSASRPPLRTRDGAVAAATAFLQALPWRVLVDDERRAAVVTRFAAAGAGSALDLRVSLGIQGVRDAVAVAPVVARPVFMGYRVSGFTLNRATVAVWGMALFGSGAYEPVSQWATSTLDLVWQRGGWRVASMRNRPGPSPRWSIEELARAVRSFEEFRHVP